MHQWCALRQNGKTYIFSDNSVDLLLGKFKKNSIRLGCNFMCASAFITNHVCIAL